MIRQRTLTFLLAWFFLFLACGPALAGVEFKPGTDWGSGFGADVIVTNDGPETIRNWTLSFEWDRSIDSIWNVDLISREGGKYVVRGPAWSPDLAPGQSASFGFNGSPGNLTSGPRKYLLNGSAVASQTDGQTDGQSDDQTEGETSGQTGDTTSGEVVNTGGATVTFHVDSDWGSGFTGSIAIANQGSGPIEGWTLTFDFPYTIGSIWDAVVKGRDGNRYTLGPAGWNGTIPAGGSVSLGFNGSPGNVTATLANVALNGTALSGGTSGTQGNAGETGSTDEGSGSTGGTTGGDTGSTGGTTGGDTGGMGVEDTGGPEHGYHVVGYFPQWGIYARDYQVSDIPADQLTHVNYAFAGIDGTTLTLKSVDEWADFQKVFPAENGLPAQTWSDSEAGRAGNLGRLGQLKALNPHLRTLLSVGGWTLSTFFSDAALNAESRARFAASCVDWMVRYGFDGIDIDWEYPVAGGLPSCPDVPNGQISLWQEKECQKYRPEDGRNYELLLAELRRQLDARSAAGGRHYLLTIAAPAGYDKLQYLPLAEMARHLDFMNVMTYDFHGAWESTTNHHSPLHPSPLDPQALAPREKYNAAWAVNRLVEAGVPAGKIVIGSPFYGRAWEEVLPANDGLFQPAGSAPAPSGSGHWETGVLDYWKIVELLDSGRGYARGYDSSAEAAYVHGPNLSAGKTIGGLFISYEDPESLTAKLDLVRSMGLGGVMFWELSGDVRDPEDPDSLLGVIRQRLGAAR